MARLRLKLFGVLGMTTILGIWLYTPKGSWLFPREHPQSPGVPPKQSLTTPARSGETESLTEDGRSGEMVANRASAGNPGLTLPRDPRKANTPAVETCTLAGRVVDDLGRPVPGSQVVLRSRAFHSIVADHSVDDPIASSGEPVPGEFRIEVKRRLQWGAIKKGASERPVVGKGQPIALQPELATRVGAVTHAWFTAEKRVDVGDLVLPRGSRYEGTVLDASGYPLGNALVSVHPHRHSDHDLQGWVGFGGSRQRRHQAVFDGAGNRIDPALPSEVLTDGAGRFSVESYRGESEVLVVTEAGGQHMFYLDPLDPGEVKADVVLRLPALTLFQINPVNKDGDPIPWSVFEETMGLATEGHKIHRSPLIEIIVAAEKGPLSTVHVSKRVGSLFCQIEGAADDVRRLEALVPGYLPSTLDLPGGIVSGQSIPLVFREPTTYPLRVRVHYEEISTQDRKALRFGALSIWASPQPPTKSGHLIDNTGLGNEASVALAGKNSPIEIRLDVQDAGSQWVGVGPEDLRSGRAMDKSFGPFETGEQIHDVRVGSLLDLQKGAKRPKRKPKGPSGVVLVQVVDALSKGPLLKADVEPRSNRGRRVGRHFQSSRPSSAGVQSLVLEEGAWTLFVSDESHQPTKVECFVRAESTLDLGKIALDPLDEEDSGGHEIRWLLGGEAVPPDSSGGLKVLNPGQGRSYWYYFSVGDGGMSEIEGSLPDRFEAKVEFTMPKGDAFWEKVEIQLRNFPEITEVRLAPHRTVRVVVEGFAAGHERLRPPLSLRSFDERRGAELAPGLPERSGTRVYRGRVAPGSYEVSLGSRLYQVSPMDLDVVSGSGELVVHMSVSRK